MRTRIWSLILRRLPYPFRTIGMEVVKTIEWCDRFAGQILVGLSRSPAWYMVTVAGVVAVGLTVLLFFSFASSNDPTIPELAARTRSKAPVTRDSMEASGDWAAQDKWRIGHFFLPHRPPKQAYHHLDHEDLTQELLGGSAQRSGRSTPFLALPDPSIKGAGYQSTVLLEPDVRLDMRPPKRAEQPKRLIDALYQNQLADTIWGFRPAKGHLSRDSRLVVQAQWSFPDDCSNYREPRRHPVTRRIVPVPDPDWADRGPIPPTMPMPVQEPIRMPVSEPTSAPANRFAELDVRMTLIRQFLPAMGEFPPRSELVAETAHSQLPDLSELPGRSNDLVYESSPWIRFRKDEHHEPTHDHHRDRGGVQPVDSQSPLIEEFVHDLERNPAPSFAEVALKLEWYASEQADAGHAPRSTLVLQNEGSELIEKIWVRESLSGTGTVVDAIPPARLNADENIADRTVNHLESGKNRRLDLVWRAKGGSDRMYQALVIVEAAAGASTVVVAPDRAIPIEPEPVEQSMPSIAPEPVTRPQPAAQPLPDERPGLSFNIKNRPRALIDDLVEIEILMRNTGDIPLHHVRLQADLPQELKHRQGSEVEYIVEELPIGGTELAVLRVVAEASGKAVCRLAASADEPVEAKANAVVHVEARPAERPRESTLQIPRPVPAPVASTPNKIGSCCCQTQPFQSVLVPESLR